MAEKDYHALSIGGKLEAIAIQENRQDLERFKKLWEANNSGSVSTLYKYILYGGELSEYIGKPFRDMTEEDIVDYVTHKKEVCISTGSLDQVKVKIKAFFRWLYGMERGKYPAQVVWLRPTGERVDHDGEEVLEDGDIQAIIDHAGNARNRGLIALLYDGCLRSSEVRSIRIKDFRINGNNVGRLHISRSKTKAGIRDIMIIDSVPHLKKWINEHPYNDDPEAPIFINWGHHARRERGKAMGANNLGVTLKRLARRAGIQKRCNPHWFRHSGLTAKSQVFNESELRCFAGWDKYSKMPSLYIHESQKIMENKLLKSKGYMIMEEEAGPSKLTPRICQNCDEPNEATAKFCSKCGAVLDIKTALKVDKAKNILQEELTIQERLLAKLDAFKSIHEEMEAFKSTQADREAEVQALRKEIELLKAKS